MRTTTWAYEIDAVQAAAHAFDSIYRCPLDHSNLSQVTCLPKENNILSTNVLRALAKIQFQGLTGSISFNKKRRFTAFSSVRYCQPSVRSREHSSAQKSWHLGQSL